MPTVYQLSQQHRAALLADDRDSSKRMIAAYVDIWKAIRAEQDILFGKMKAARANGEEITIGWLQQGDRLSALLAVVEEQLTRFAKVAGNEITGQQRKAVSTAIANAQQLVLQAGQDAGIGIEWNHLPTSTVENLVGVLGDGSPVVEALVKRFTVGTKQVPGALEQIRRAFITGAALGQNPREIARTVAKAGAMPLDKALTISRTEVLRAARESTRASFAENSDAVVAWRWVASLTIRTCGMCIAMHGTIHPVDEVFGTHPNCRCAMVPVLRGQEDAPFRTGEDWLRDQEEVVQNNLLGADGAAAWRAGDVALSAFVHTTESDKWGLGRRMASLAQVKERIRNNA